MASIKVINTPIGIRMGSLVALDKKRKIKAISPILLKALLGGQWPDFDGFNFNEVHNYRLENGRLVPYDFVGDIVPGPDFKVSMIRGSF
ncbi:MAG: hypothetical protein NTZ97_04690 [Candidatus Moranbacteria bacterium]|nr:hypothetical protein [Candidatus Moranbacteria bacterium]